MRVSSYGGDRFELTNVSEEEQDALQRMMLGLARVRMGEKGELEVLDVHDPVPPPTADEAIAPFFSAPELHAVQKVLPMADPFEGGHDPGIIIQHLCAYSFSPEGYQAQAERLEAWGFECLRSRRNDAGKYWEHWVLHGLWAAKGDLRDALEDVGRDLTLQDDPVTDRLERRRVKLEAAIAFLCKRASFGTLDVFWQRAAAILE